MNRYKDRRLIGVASTQFTPPAIARNRDLVRCEKALLPSRGTSLLLAVLGFAFPLLSPAADITDTFTRANSTTTLGNTETGQAWTAAKGVWGINSNRAYTVSGTSGDQIAVVTSPSGDGFAEAKIVTLGSWVGVVFRYQDLSNYWKVAADIGGGRWTVARVVGGTQGGYQYITQAPAAGNVLRVETSGSTITVFINGVQKLQFSDTALQTATGKGLVGHSAGLAARFDDFSCTGVNTPPTVSLTSPANGATFTQPVNITINANAADTDGTVTQVAFYEDGNLLGTDTTSPYSIVWNNASTGTSVLTAVATDNLGATTTSAGVSITVNAASGITDTFTRPNNATSMGSTETGGQTWTAATGTWGITSNQAYTASGSGGDQRAVVNSQADGFVQATTTTLGSWIGLLFRYQDTSNYWKVAADISGGRWTIARVVGGTQGGYQYITQPPAVGDVLRVETSGSTITVFINGVQKIQFTDSALQTANKAGLLGHSAGLAARFDDFSATAPVTVPPTPTGLTATAVSSSQINLAWTDVATETGYKIERKTGAGGIYAEIATVSANVVSYNNTGLAASTTYYYRIRAYNASGDSGYSNEANATTGAGGSGGTCYDKADKFKNPFNKNSAFHRPMGSGATYAGSGHAATIAWLAAPHSIGINTVNGSGVFITQNNSSHPTKTVAWNQQGTGDNLPFTLRIPNGFDGGTTGSDWLATVYDTAAGGTIFQQFYHFDNINNSNNYEARIRRPTSSTGLGHADVGSSIREGATASGMSEIAGLLRGHEINDTSPYEIHHALNLILPRRPDQCAMLMADYPVWPANHVDWNANDGPGGNNDGPIPYGALMAIPPTNKGGPDLNSLGLTTRQMRVALALRDYGAYVMDGGQCVKMRGDNTITSDARTDVMNGLAILYQYMRMVTNNSASQTYSGGGTAMNANCINCAFDAP